jgi:hypothetical protein
MKRSSIPNTQSPRERALWRTLSLYRSMLRQRKKEQYGLASNREADLYRIPPAGK